MKPPVIDQKTHDIALAGTEYGSGLLPRVLAAIDKAEVQSVLYDAIVAALLVQQEMLRPKPIFSRN